MCDHTSSSRPIRSVKPAEESFASIAKGICDNAKHGQRSTVRWVCIDVHVARSAMGPQADLRRVQAGHLPQIMVEVV